MSILRGGRRQGGATRAEFEGKGAGNLWKGGFSLGFG